MKNLLYFQKIQARLNVFAKRYYFNQLLQNTGIYIASAALLITALSVLEFVFNNGSGFRMFLFFTLTLSLVAGFFYLVLMPALRAFSLVKRMPEELMSKVIGGKMRNVDDKLLNVLLLSRMRSDSNNEILNAAIEQKSKMLSEIPFHLSAGMKRGLIFLRNAGILMVVILLTGMTFPDVFQYGTKRLVYFNSEIKPPVPFYFEVTNGLTAIRNESHEIEIAVKGNAIPKSVYVILDNKELSAQRQSDGKFKLFLKSVTNDLQFKVFAGEIESEEYVVKVLDRPGIVEMDISVTFPPYLKRNAETFHNLGNISIPEGSNVKWRAKVENGAVFNLGFKENNFHLPIIDGDAVFDSTFKESFDYSFSAIADYGLKSDTINYKINVEPDMFPLIEILDNVDSVSGNTQILGRISDDYGFSSFRFYYKTDSDESFKFNDLSFDRNSTNFEFLYDINLNTWELEKGESVSYFFEVGDNDGVNGHKKTRSSIIYMKIDDEKSMMAKSDKMKHEVEKSLEEVILETKELNEEITGLKEQLLKEKKVDWNSKKKLEEMVKKNENLKKRLQEINRENKKRNALEKEISDSEEINKKREELEKLMDDVLSDEMLEKLKELERMIDEMSKEKLNEKVEELEMDNEHLKNELDRSLELFRQLEFEKQLQKVTSDLDELIKEQKELRSDSEENKGENLSEEQEGLKSDFEDWEKEMSELSDLNEKLENKHSIPDEKEKSEGVKEDMNNAIDDLKKGKNKKAGGSQKSAEEKMEELKNDLDAMLMAMESAASEDLNSLRKTLENLIKLSFEQEGIMEGMHGLRPEDPKYNDFNKRQRAALDGMKIVEDSLFALSKRVVQIQSIINKEVNDVNLSMERSIRAMTERKSGMVSRQQQLSMTSINNLALLLDEVIDQIQQQMMQNSGQCSKPGNSKPSSSSMQGMQKQMNKQLEQMKKMLEEGSSKGEGKGKKGDGGDSESLARMAAEQAKIREELRKMAESAGQNDAKELRKLGDLMEESERDIVNRRITAETIERQEKILTKLLEAENADREQDMEERRESEIGLDKRNGNILDIKEYYRAKNNHENLIKQNIGFNRYISDRVDEYFKNINK